MDFPRRWYRTRQKSYRTFIWHDTPTLQQSLSFSPNLVRVLWWMVNKVSMATNLENPPVTLNKPLIIPVTCDVGSFRHPAHTKGHGLPNECERRLGQEDLDLMLSLSSIHWRRNANLKHIQYHWQIVHENINGDDCVKGKPYRESFELVFINILGFTYSRIMCHGPLAKYEKLWVRMRRKCRERFPRHRG